MLHLSLSVSLLQKEKGTAPGHAFRFKSTPSVKQKKKTPSPNPPTPLFQSLPLELDPSSSPRESPAAPSPPRRTGTVPSPRPPYWRRFAVVPQWPSTPAGPPPLVVRPPSTV